MGGGGDPGMRGSRLGSKMAGLRGTAMFSSFTGRDNARTEADPFASDSRIIHEQNEISAIGDFEPPQTGKRSKGKSSSGSIKISDSTGSGTGTVLRGFRDALKEKLDSQLETREVKHNTRLNRSKFSAQELLKEIEALQAEALTPRATKSKSEDTALLQESFTFSLVSVTSPRTGCGDGARFVETVQVRTVCDNGSDIWYEHSEMAIDYTTRKHVLTFEAHNVGEVSDCDLLV